VPLLKRPLWLVILVCLGCSAQTQNPNAELNKRIERQVRSAYSIPPEVQVAVGERKPSEFPGYESLEVSLSQGSHKSSYTFLLSQDRKTLIRMTRLDLSTDPYTDMMSKISTAGRPVRGARDAKVSVVVYDDLQCPFCSHMHETLFRQVFNDYKDRVKVIYKDYPLFQIHPWAGRAANDANCLAEQNNDAFWDFADALHMDATAVNGPGPAKRGLPEKLAALDVLAMSLGAKHGVEPSKLQACIKAQSDKTVQDSVHEADALGVSATPTLFINGRKLEGALDASELRAALNDALRDAGQPVPSIAAAPAQPATANK